MFFGSSLTRTRYLPVIYDTFLASPFGIPMIKGGIYGTMLTSTIGVLPIMSSTFSNGTMSTSSCLDPRRFESRCLLSGF